MDLCKIFEINPNKCTNCHVCISVCPVKYCMIDDKKVKIDPNFCIGCGRCYKACPFDAINLLDDFNEFLANINSAKKIILIVSPAYIIKYYDDSKKFIGWLRKHFVPESIFDESLGAEFSGILHSEFLKKSKKRPLLTQQCASIIEYIKIYQPSLINNIVPLFSPTLITALFIRKLLNYNGIIAYLGSCPAKRREFNDLKSSRIIQYNLTFESISKYIQNNNIDLVRFEESDFDLLPAERGKVFCKPGGLINIIQKYDKDNTMFNIEGETIYNKYFKGLIENIDKNYLHLPDLIESQDCEGGCFRGSGIINNLSVDEENWIIKETEMRAINDYYKEFKNQKIYNKILVEQKGIIFNKNYSPENQNTISTLGNNELKNVYSDLNKSETIDFLNCRSCGFKTCQEFATSYFYKLNKNNNCRVYVENFLYKELTEATSSLEEIVLKIENSYQSSSNLKQYIVDIKKIFEILKSSIDNIINFNQSLKENIEKFQPIISAISEVSEQINLLSFNASIEASRTGEQGKGFTVVASEIRTLADKTNIEIEKINSIIEVIIRSSTGIQQNSSSLNERSKEFIDSFQNLSKLINLFEANIEKLHLSSKND